MSTIVFKEILPWSPLHMIINKNKDEIVYNTEQSLGINLWYLVSGESFCTIEKSNIKDIHRENTPSNKTQTLTKNMKINTLVIGTLNRSNLENYTNNNKDQHNSERHNTNKTRQRETTRF